METVYLVLTGVLSIVSPVVSVLVALRAVKRQSIDDAVARAKTEERMAKDLEFIKGNVCTICDGQKEVTASVRKLESRVTAVEESAKSAHKRIDELRGV